MSAITLLQQAKIEKKRRQYKNTNLDLKTMSRSEIIQVLLPNYVIQDKPRAFHDSTKPDKYVIGGYGSGKTYTFCAEGIFLNWANMGLEVLLVIQTQSNSNLTTTQSLKLICKDNSIEYESREIKGVNYFDIAWGSKEEEIGHFLIASGYDPDSLAGPTVAAAGIDECFLQKKETFEVVIARARDPRAVINEVFFASTIKPLEQKWGHNVCENDYYGDDKTFKVTIPTTENKFATKEFIERLERNYDEETQRVLIKGENISVKGISVYRYKDTTKKKSEDLLMPKPGGSIIKLLLGFDFNVGIMCAGELWLDKFIRRQIDEYKIHDSNTDELCQLIINRMLDKYSGITDSRKLDYSLNIFMDAAAKQRKSSAKIGVTDARIVRDSFVNAGFNCHITIPNENPPVRDRVQNTNNLLDKESFVIYDNCKHSIMCRKFTKYKEGAEGFIVVTNGLWSHMSAAVDYALWHSQRMIPQEVTEGEEYRSVAPGIIVMNERKFK
ncbi:MAG: hypothetical protein HGGPFJEG_03075 [Ignavibacteria bacterium]|nr:hypothetical protein [Ignavibacteria bacterium]